MIACVDCKIPYPPDSIPYICPHCGGIYDFTAPPPFDPERIEPDLPGYWRYRLSPSSPVRG